MKIKIGRWVLDVTKGEVDYFMTGGLIGLGWALMWGGHLFIGALVWVCALVNVSLNFRRRS